jgi:hypothetical protein
MILAPHFNRSVCHFTVTCGETIYVVNLRCHFRKEFTFLHPHIGYSCLKHGDLLRGGEAHIYTTSMFGMHTL